MNLENDTDLLDNICTVVGSRDDSALREASRVWRTNNDGGERANDRGPVNEDVRQRQDYTAVLITLGESAEVLLGEGRCATTRRS